MNDYDVIIPTRNQSKYLNDSINSVIEQSILPNEIIIINDNSNDNTFKVCVEIFKKKKFVNYKIINNSETLGPAKSRNIGIRQAKSKFIAFLDSDDYWEKTKIEKQFEKFNKPNFSNLGVIYTSHNFMINNNLVHHHNRSQKASYNGFLYYKLLSGNIISGSCSSALCKREVFEKCGYFSENSEDYFIEDWDLWQRISKKFNFDFVDENLLTIRIHKQNRSMEKNNDIDNALVRVFNKNKRIKNLSKNLIRKLDNNILTYSVRPIFIDDYYKKKWINIIKKLIKLFLYFLINFEIKQALRLLKISSYFFVKKILKIGKSNA